MKEGEEHFIGKVACKGVIVSPQGRVLVCRNAWDHDLWDLPGGVLNSGETPQIALIREIREEIGIEAVIAGLLWVGTYIKRNSGKQVVAIVFKCVLDREGAEFSFDDEEIAEVRWIGKEELKEISLFPELHRILEKFFA